MVIDPLPVWKAELQKLPPTADAASAALNISKWYSDRIIAIGPNPSALVDPGFKFTFPVPVFQQELLKIAPVPDALAGAKQFADAWEVAIKASVALSLPGAAIPPPTPSTTFSVVFSTVIDPDSIALGKTKILELVDAPPALTALDSRFADIFYDATLLLTITVTGLSSDLPPPGGPGPLPLTAPKVPLI